MKPLRYTSNEAKEALRMQELEEARSRAIQLEKTMRWWVDCTANWREKWSKVRSERNKAREEIKSLQTKLDVALKENSVYKRQKQNLELQHEQMRKELEQIHLLLLKHAGQWDNQLLEAIQCMADNVELTPLKASDQDSIDGCCGKDSGIEEYVLYESVPKHAVELLHDVSDITNQTCCDDTLSNISELSIDYTAEHRNNSDELLRCNLSTLQLKLDESAKTIAAEREEKISLHKSLEKLETELTDMKKKCEDLKTSKQEVVRELLLVKDTHSDTVALIKADLANETTTREDVDRRLMDVRTQLERLQAENASEWGKRERLETEKLSLERENKKLRAELKDVVDRLERRINIQPNAGNELRSLQLELADKNKELNDMKQIQAKMKKALTDKSVELNHTIRRIEQYETEVKKLRLRVEELKRDLAIAEDEIDTNSNNFRKLQRSNDDLQEQVDNLQVQLQHVCTRLRSKAKKTVLRIHSRSSDEVTDEDTAY